MKRTYFPGIIDIVEVTDPAEIRTISNDSRFDRDFIRHGPVRNVQRLRKMLRIFSLNGRLFAPMLPRTNPSRAAAQDELWSRLNVKADEVKHGSAQLEPLAEWVRGIGTAEKLDLLVQQSIGRLFVETFTATEESLATAHMVLEAASSSNLLRMLGWRISGRLERAKTLLASMVNGDLTGVIAEFRNPGRRSVGRSGVVYCGSSSPDCSRTMYSAYRSGQFGSALPMRFSRLPRAASARRSAVARSLAEAKEVAPGSTRPGSLVVTSCRCQPLPSGSLNKARER
jgi:hypothetical protein